MKSLSHTFLFSSQVFLTTAKWVTNISVVITDLLIYRIDANIEWFLVLEFSLLCGFYCLFYP